MESQLTFKQHRQLGALRGFDREAFVDEIEDDGAAVVVLPETERIFLVGRDGLRVEE